MLPQSTWALAREGRNRSCATGTEETSPARGKLDFGSSCSNLRHNGISKRTQTIIERNMNETRSLRRRIQDFCHQISDEGSKE